MTLYRDSQFPVPDDLTAVHGTQLRKFGQPGTWGTGAQRLAVVAAARQAGIDAGVLEAPAEGGATSEVELPKVVRDVIRQVAVAPKDVDQAFYEDAVGSGLGDAEYTEIVALVSFICGMDVFARGIGVPLRPLAEAEPGEPTRERPAEAVQEEAWVPTIPNPPDGGALAEELFGKFKPYIMRAVSLVPDECRDHMALEGVQYMPLAKVPVFDHQHHEGLTRPQVEIVAGRVSALNDCFY